MKLDDFQKCIVLVFCCIFWSRMCKSFNLFFPCVLMLKLLFGYYVILTKATFEHVVKVNVIYFKVQQVTLNLKYFKIMI
jgi:hypothetical protein